MNNLSDVRSRAVLFPVLFILFIYSGNALATAHKLNIVPIIVSSLLGGDPTIFYRDSDGDTYGDPDVFQTALTQPAGYVSNNFDCNDSDPDTYPGATEIADSIDNNCNGEIDEGLGTSYYRDADADTYGDPAASQVSLIQPDGYVSNNFDCDDTDSGIHPGATEISDGKDNNCDGQVDEGLGTSYYRDADADTYGDPGVLQAAATQPSGYVENSADCDDSNASINPGATEADDGVDNNCDGQIDEGFYNSVFYRDADRDSYGDPLLSWFANTQPAGYVSQGNDCDDSDSTINPDAIEIIDGKDNNCDGVID